MITWLTADDPFPPVACALIEPEGLLAAGADLSPRRLIDAYRHGIFPWYNAGQPPLWWSTNPRMVLFTDELRVSRSLAKTARALARNTARTCAIQCDTHFEAVMRACAQSRPGQDGTWISEPMIEAYLRLHRMGIAHSIETWIDGELCGGLYGLAIGRMFYGESMFTRRTDASKLALVALVAFLRRHDFPMIDCQQQTVHLASLGARPIARTEFIERLEFLIAQDGIERWPDRLPLVPVESTSEHRDA